MASAAARRAAWFAVPAIAMVAYGYTFHMGFFNYYLALGFSFWGIAIAWRGRPSELWLLVPIAALAAMAHPLGLAWLVAGSFYVFAATRLRLPLHIALPRRVRGRAGRCALLFLASQCCRRTGAAVFLFQRRRSISAVRRPLQNRRIRVPWFHCARDHRRYFPEAHGRPCSEPRTLRCASRIVRGDPRRRAAASRRHPLRESSAGSGATHRQAHFRFRRAAVLHDCGDAYALLASRRIPRHRRHIFQFRLSGHGARERNGAAGRKPDSYAARQISASSA